jgi:hypothetical protein
MPLAVSALARGADAEAVEHCLAASSFTTRHAETYGIAAITTAYAGDLDGARALHERGRSGEVSFTARSWRAYVSGEIEGAAGHHDLAERHYLDAIELAGRAGLTFTAGVAMVGLVSVRAAAGRVPEALRGHREVVDYFARTGNWTHLWPALRNLASLLRQLGDPEPATALEVAADQAPEAPATGRTPHAPDPACLPAGTRRNARAEVLGIARRAIQRHLQDARPHASGGPAPSSPDAVPQ